MGRHQGRDPAHPAGPHPRLQPRLPGPEGPQPGGEDPAEVRAAAPVPPQVALLLLPGRLQADEGRDAARRDQGAGPPHQEEDDHLSQRRRQHRHLIIKHRQF